MSEIDVALQALRQSLSDLHVSMQEQLDRLDEAQQKTEKGSSEINETLHRFEQEIVCFERMRAARGFYADYESLLGKRCRGNEDIRNGVLRIVRDFDYSEARAVSLSQMREDMWVNGTNYWLYYAYRALVAWIQNDRNTCEIAVKESMRKSSSRTALFFSLMNLRFQREDATRKWLRVYLGGLDPRKLDHYAERVLDAYMHGVFGKDDLIEGLFAKWYMDGEEAFRQAYRDCFDTADMPVPFNFECMGEFVMNVDECAGFYRRYSICHEIYGELEALDAFDLGDINESHRQLCRETLLELIAEQEMEEHRIKMAMDYYQDVIDSGGSQVEQKKDPPKETISFATYVVKRIMDASQESDVRMKLLAFSRDAFMNVLEESEEQIETFHLKIGDWESDSDGRDLKQQQENLRYHLKKELYDKHYFDWVNFVLAALLPISLLLLIWSVNALFITVISAAFIIARCFIARERVPEIMEAQLDDLEDTMEEIGEFKFDCAIWQGEKEELVELIASQSI